MPWEISSERSVYLQLIDIIKQKIMSGEYKPGQRMESVRELAAEAAVNPNTMQRALTELEREGFLFTQRTSGRFISEDAAKIAELRLESVKKRAKEFYLEMQKNGLSSDEIIQLIQKTAEETKAEG